MVLDTLLISYFDICETNEVGAHGTKYPPP